MGETANREASPLRNGRQLISREREHQVTPHAFEHGEQARHAGDSPL
jgi:hypothetical protein